MAKEKVKRIPPEELQRARDAFNERVRRSMLEAFEMRQREWGINKAWLARKVGRSQAQIERMLVNGKIGLGTLGVIAYGVGADLTFDVVPLETLKPK